MGKIDTGKLIKKKIHLLIYRSPHCLVVWHLIYMADSTLNHPASTNNRKQLKKNQAP